MSNSNKTALIVGAGPGLSASVARKLAAQGYQVALAGRNPAKLEALVAGIGATLYVCDAASVGDVVNLFDAVSDRLGAPSVVIYNPSLRVPGPIAQIDPSDVQRALAVTAFGGFLVGQQSARVMRAGGTILFTGASASVKGYAQSAAFAMGKFALRGLAQSMARELGPQGIHVAHIIIDGAIRSASRRDPADAPDSTLDPEAIADSYLSLIAQPRSAWTHEIELRPYCERF